MRLSWYPATLVERRAETPTVATLVLRVPGWPGHLPGQHVDVRLTAEDGYSTQRSYSLAAPDHGAVLEITVQALGDGEVSPFLVEGLVVGDPVELRGPVGGWFVWSPVSVAGLVDRVLLVAGGSGVVPLMAMVRARHEAGSTVPMRLVYSVRTPADVIYADELDRLAKEDDGLEVLLVHTREAPPGSGRPAGRLSADELATLAWPPADDVRAYVCGPTAFVDAAAAGLVRAGYHDAAIRTERFGGE
ncbi:MAG: ferredoxin reductase [Nocardioidaceae bacterium]|nr:ferredoxin reductase [Nocardioidaceae bacterium]